MSFESDDVAWRPSRILRFIKEDIWLPDSNRLLLPAYSRRKDSLSRGLGIYFNGMSTDSKVSELNLDLPPAPTPMGVYKPIVIVGNIAYLSGHGPLQSDGSLFKGRVGSEVDQDAGYAAARQTGLAMLATLKVGLGSLDRVKRVIKLLGMVNCDADFENHPAVINGCSDLLAEVFGEDSGVGARSAIGMGSLPGNISVEIEGIFEIE